MAIAAAVDTIEGTLAGDIWFHLDVGNDVLYLRRAPTRSLPVYGEETTEGYTRLTTDDGEYAGATVARFWRTYGEGDVQTATFAEVRDRIVEWDGAHSC